MIEVKVEPTPMALCTLMSPPRSLARWRLIDNPKPVPLYLRVVLLSTWRNSSKISPNLSAECQYRYR